MREAVSIPVTVKCRIGIDELEDYGFFEWFVLAVQKAGVDVFVVHARKAILQGLTPKENREIPPLRYDVPDAAQARAPGTHGDPERRPQDARRRCASGCRSSTA